VLGQWIMVTLLTPMEFSFIAESVTINYTLFVFCVKLVTNM